MNDIKAAAAAIQNAFENEEYPAEFLDQYDQLERLAGSHGTETFLVRQKSDHQLCVAKCYDKNLYSTVQESGILKFAQSQGIACIFGRIPKRPDRLHCPRIRCGNAARPI